MRRREEAEKYKDAEKILEVGLCIHVSKMRIGKLYFGNMTMLQIRPYFQPKITNILISPQKHM